jgi:hypothetical protein
MYVCRQFLWHPKYSLASSPMFHKVLVLRNQIGLGLCVNMLVGISCMHKGLLSNNALVLWLHHKYR